MCFGKKIKKFDWHVDSLQLGAQFLQARTVADYPRMLKKIPAKSWQNFFVQEAGKLKKNILQ